MRGRARARVVSDALTMADNHVVHKNGAKEIAYEPDATWFPSALREVISALESGTMARAAIGDQVVDHYLSYARTEQSLFDKVVTDWERTRYFERG